MCTNYARICQELVLPSLSTTMDIVSFQHPVSARVLPPICATARAWGSASCRFPSGAEPARRSLSPNNWPQAPNPTEEIPTHDSETTQRRCHERLRLPDRSTAPKRRLEPGRGLARGRAGRTRGKEWEDWDRSVTENLERIQNKDGSWTGHHCITGRTFCTAAALLVLLADRSARAQPKSSPCPEPAKA